MQLSYLKSWADGSIFYLSKMLVEQVGIDKRYSNIRKCIGINILDFKYIRNTDRFHTSYHILEDKDYTLYTDVMEWHIIELPKLPANTDGTSLYDWAKFINTSVYLDEAYKQLEVISQDQEKRLEYTARQKALYDYNTMMEERFNAGVEQGAERERKVLIEKLKKSGFTDEQIMNLLK